MKVLWFSINSSLYDASQKVGLSWIAALETLIKTETNIQLGIAFEHNDDSFKVIRNNVTYYPIHAFKTKAQKRLRRFNKTEAELIIPKAIEVIKDFQPDVIHVFGSEWCWGLVQEYTDIPVVIHMQGSIPPYNNASLPPGYSKKDLNPYKWWKIKDNIYRKLALQFERDRAIREERILKGCRYFMGRTCWDYALTKFYSPNSKYFECWEAIRNIFINETYSHDYNKSGKCILMTTLSQSNLKGHDTILKTAKLLKTCTDFDFEWHIAGCYSLPLYEIKENVKVSDVNVKYLGPLDTEHLYNELKKCTLYIHPAYIDNSPNAVCEAMCMGLPIIATYVGGVPSLIKHEESGILVPANDPFQMAFHIKDLFINRNKAKQYGKRAQIIGLERHNPQNIIKVLKEIYTTIITENKNNTHA